MNMKINSIEWHKNILSNREESAKRKREEAIRVMAEADRLDRECVILSLQIEAAEKAGKDSFDADKFLKGKK